MAAHSKRYVRSLGLRFTVILAWRTLLCSLLLYAAWLRLRRRWMSGIPLLSLLGKEVCFSIRSCPTARLQSRQRRLVLPPRLTSTTNMMLTYAISRQSLAS